MKERLVVLAFAALQVSGNFAGGALLGHAEAAGLRSKRRIGGSVSYFASFRAP